MNNLNFSTNLNSQNYGPQFSQSGNNFNAPNYQVAHNMHLDTCQISTKKKEKTTLEKCLTAMAWMGGICLGGFGIYKAVEYFKPGTFKKLAQTKQVEEKSQKEQTFLQKFNTEFNKYLEQPDKFKQQEMEYINNALKNSEIDKEECEKLLKKVEMRKKIRELNSSLKVKIPLTPYGGVEEIDKANDKLKNTGNEEQKKLFDEILAYKIEKLNVKIKLIEQRKDKKDTYMQNSLKYCRTKNILEALTKIRNGGTNKTEIFQVNYEAQELSEEFISTNGYTSQVKNELGETFDINLSEDTFKAMFDEKHEMLQQRLSDCYLVGTLNAILNHPTRRCDFYKMFSEDEKSIIFKFKDDFEVKFPKDAQGKPKLLNSSSPNNNASIPIGYKMFEEAYALHRLYKRAEEGYVKKQEKISKDDGLASSIKEYAGNIDKNCELEKFLKSNDNYKQYIDQEDPKDPKGLYASLLAAGTIHEVANTLFNSKTNACCLEGYHDYNDKLPDKTKNTDEEISQTLIKMMNDGKSIVVGRDEFNVYGNEEKYNYNGIDIHNSHFSVVRYYNPKTQEVHIFESNDPSKVLILPLSIFNKQYSLLYGF